MSCNKDTAMQRQQSDVSSSDEVDDLIKQDIERLASLSSPQVSNTSPKFQMFSGGILDLLSTVVIGIATGPEDEEDLEKKAENKESVISAVTPYYKSQECIKDYTDTNSRNFSGYQDSSYSDNNDRRYFQINGYRFGDLKYCSAKYTSVSLYVTYSVDSPSGGGKPQVWGWSWKLKEGLTLNMSSEHLDYLHISHPDLSKGGKLEKILQEAATKADPSTIQVTFYVNKEPPLKTTVFKLNNHGVRAFAKFANYEVFENTLPSQVLKERSNNRTPYHHGTRTSYYDNHVQRTLYNSFSDGRHHVSSSMNYRKPHADLEEIRQDDYYIMKRFFKVFVEALHAEE